MWNKILNLIFWKSPRKEVSLTTEEKSIKGEKVSITLEEFEDICYVHSSWHTDPHPPGGGISEAAFFDLRKKLDQVMDKRDELPIYMGLHPKIDEAIELRMKDYKVEFTLQYGN